MSEEMTCYEQIIQLKETINFRRTAENCTTCRHYHYPEKYHETEECRRNAKVIFSVNNTHICNAWEVNSRSKGVKDE